MTAHDDMFADAGAALLEQFGRAVQYRPAGASAILVSLTADVGDITVAEVEGRAGRIKERRRSFKFHRNPLSPYGGVDDPAMNASIEVDGERWEIRSKKLDAVFAEVETVAVGAIEVSVPGYRPQRM